jgi:hypothetical protein
MEKVENLYRTARAQNVLPTQLNTLDHACATQLCGDREIRATPFRTP